MAPCKKKPTYFYLSSSSCANLIQCGKVKVPCKFTKHTVKIFLVAKKNSYMGRQLVFRGVLPEGEGGTKKIRRNFFPTHPGGAIQKLGSPSAESFREEGYKAGIPSAKDDGTTKGGKPSSQVEGRHQRGGAHCAKSTRHAKA